MLINPTLIIIARVEFIKFFPETIPCQFLHDFLGVIKLIPYLDFLMHGCSN